MDTMADAGVTSIDSSTAWVTERVVVPEMLPDVAVIVVVPTPTEVASPLVPVTLLIVATFVFEEFQETDDVIFCVELSVNVPVAVNCCVVPRAMLGFAGVTVIDVSTAGVTVRVAKLETPEKVELMVAVPSETAVANPFEPAISPMVATPAFEEVQVAHVVNDCVVASANVPVAVNCWVVPLAILAAVGKMSIDATEDDVNVANPDTPPYVAEIIAEPAATALANPFEPDTLLMVTTPVSNEAQVAHAVRLCVSAFSRVPVAVNCWVVPGAILGMGGFNGATEIDATDDVVMVARPLMVPEVAVMVVVPVDTAVANPFDPAVSLTEAIAWSNESHVTDEVRFCLAPFEKVPCAVN
jgi:hypothetical protein